MPMWLQHLVVFVLVGGSCALIGWQGVQALRGKKSKLGSCCAKGCDAGSKPKSSDSNPAKPATPRTHFMPVEMLQRRR